MFQELVKKLLWSWEKASDEQILAWANGESWPELQALAQQKAAQQSVPKRPPDWLYCPHCGELMSDHLITERGGYCK